MKRWIALGLMMVCCMARADDSRWYLQLDNDAVFGTDRWYTAGQRISRVKDDLEIGVLQEIYTPDGKKEPALRDRAPTARLIPTIARHFYDEGVFQTLELGVGVRGPSALGRQTTQSAHHLVTAAPIDWSRQLSDEVDAHVAAVRSQSLFSDFFKIHYGAVVGNVMTYAHAGFELRAGDKTLASLPLRFASTPPFSRGSPCNWSAYVGVSERAIARNELIGRNYNQFGPELVHRRSVGRLATGFAYRARWGVVAFDLVNDSQEFNGQGEPFRFGSLTIHVPF
jgi:lipid A 3-O-deacylase